MNMQQILSDPELLAEFERAYELAAPYRARVQYRLSIINQAIAMNGMHDNFIYHPIHGVLLAIHPIRDVKQISPTLNV